MSGVSTQEDHGQGETKLAKVKRVVPWWIKIGIKIIFTHLKMTHFWWEPANRKDNTQYSFSVFKSHFNRATPRAGFTCLELGPGGMASSALLTKAFGGSASVQVDVVPHASKDIEAYKPLSDLVAEQGLPRIDLTGITNFAQYLNVCNSQYLVEGLSSLRTVSTASIDFVYSQSCLEHIRAGEFLETMREIRRVLKDDGAASHRVDLRDHLSESLNNLRFSDEVWESKFMASSGFYTNRIRFGEMIGIMEDAGFDCDIVVIDRWSNLPTPRKKMQARFRDIPETDLLVAGFNVVCRPKK